MMKKILNKAPKPITDSNMKQTRRFYKEEETGEWFIDLPEWPGEKAALQMVAGADTLLDTLSKGEAEVKLLFSDEDLVGANDMMLYHQEPGEEGWGYYILSELGIKRLPEPMSIGLCPVTRFVFDGKFPLFIYFNKVS